MRHIEPIEYGSAEYLETLELRNRVMRIPLGLDMSHKGVHKVEYLCVDFDLQGSGIGGELLDRLEAMAAEQGGKKMYLDARVTAQPFYTRRGYETTSEVFIMECAPVPHVAMEKPL